MLNTYISILLSKLLSIRQFDKGIIKAEEITDLGLGSPEAKSEESLVFNINF